MPYLKIKTANGTSSDWTVINNLNLDTLSVSGNITIGDTTTNTNILTINTTNTTSAATFKSTGAKDGQTQSVEISNGELKIQSPGKTALSLGTYLNLNTSGCTVGSSGGEDPNGYDWPGSGKTPKKGDLFIQLKTVGEGEKQTTYSLLWYYDNEWKQVHAIWG